MREGGTCALTIHDVLQGRCPEGDGAALGEQGWLVPGNLFSVDKRSRRLSDTAWSLSRLGYPGSDCHRTQWVQHSKRCRQRATAASARRYRLQVYQVQLAVLVVDQRGVQRRAGGVVQSDVALGPVGAEGVPGLAVHGHRLHLPLLREHLQAGRAGGLRRPRRRREPHAPPLTRRAGGSGAAPWRSGAAGAAV